MPLQSFDVVKKDEGRGKILLSQTLGVFTPLNPGEVHTHEESTGRFSNLPNLLR